MANGCSGVRLPLYTCGARGQKSESSSRGDVRGSLRGVSKRTASIRRPTVARPSLPGSPSVFQVLKHPFLTSTRVGATGFNPSFLRHG